MLSSCSKYILKACVLCVHNVLLRVLHVGWTLLRGCRGAGPYAKNWWVLRHKVEVAVGGQVEDTLQQLHLVGSSLRICSEFSARNYLRWGPSCCQVSLDAGRDTHIRDPFMYLDSYFIFAYSLAWICRLLRTFGNPPFCWEIQWRRLASELWRWL